MNKNIQVLCDACAKCEKFQVEQTTLWADEKPYEHLLYCKHIEICQNAVDIWEKHIKEEKQNEIFNSD